MMITGFDVMRPLYYALITSLGFDSILEHMRVWLPLISLKDMVQITEICLGQAIKFVTASHQALGDGHWIIKMVTHSRVVQVNLSFGVIVLVFWIR